MNSPNENSQLCNVWKPSHPYPALLDESSPPFFQSQLNRWENHFTNHSQNNTQDVQMHVQAGQQWIRAETHVYMTHTHTSSEGDAVWPVSSGFKGLLQFPTPWDLFSSLLFITELNAELWEEGKGLKGQKTKTNSKL